MRYGIIDRYEKMLLSAIKPTRQKRCVPIMMCSVTWLTKKRM